MNAVMVPGLIYAVEQMRFYAESAAGVDGHAGDRERVATLDEAARVLSNDARAAHRAGPSGPLVRRRVAPIPCEPGEHPPFIYPHYPESGITPVMEAGLIHAAERLAGAARHAFAHYGPRALRALTLDEAATVIHDAALVAHHLGTCPLVGR